MPKNDSEHDYPLFIIRDYAVQRFVQRFPDMAAMHRSPKHMLVQLLRAGVRKSVRKRMEGAKHKVTVIENGYLHAVVRRPKLDPDKPESDVMTRAYVVITVYDTREPLKKQPANHRAVKPRPNTMKDFKQKKQKRRSTW